MSLNDIVTVNISAETQALTRTGFGIPAVLAYHTHFTERYRSYENVDDMATDGFAVTEAAYLAAQALFAQNPKPTSVIIGRSTVDSPKKVNFIPILQTVPIGVVYSITLNGHTATYTTVGPTPTVAIITAGLKTAIDLLSAGVTVTDNHTSLDIAATTVAQFFSHYVNDRTLFIQLDTTPNTVSIVSDITALRTANDEWYCLIMTNCGTDVLAAAAAYIETTFKEMTATSADDAILTSATTGNVAYVLHHPNYARTFIGHHPKASVQYFTSAWTGRCLPKDPGSLTWKFKTLAGVDPVDYTSTEIGYMKANGCNYYSTIAGLNITQEGVVCAGSTSVPVFIDIIQSRDFMHARIQEEVFGDLARSDKIPFTDPGILKIETDVRSVLTTCVQQGILSADPAPTVTVPKAVDVSISDKATRHLTDIKFSGVFAGAVHSLVIDGTVSV